MTVWPYPEPYYFPLPATMASKIGEIVDWMVGEVERKGYLDHEAAASAVWQRYGSAGWQRFTYRAKWNDKHSRLRRGRRLHPEIVRAFRQRTAKTVIAEKDHRAWRKRRLSRA